MTDFGRDVYCDDSIRTGRYASGAVLVGQRYFHRLIAIAGQIPGNEDDRNFGEALNDLIGLPGGPDTERQIRSKLNRAADLEEAILSVDIAITTTRDSVGDYTHEIAVDAKTDVGPFRLVLALGTEAAKIVSLTT